MFPPCWTHERLYPLWGLLATARRAFYCFTRLAHELACKLAYDFRFRFIVDSYCELQRVPAVLFAIVAPGAGSKIYPTVFTESDACSMFPTPGGQAHAVLFRGENIWYLVPFVIPGG